MHTDNVCAKGHEWSTKAGDNPSDTCPICGADSITMPGKWEQLPPPPSGLAASTPRATAPSGYQIETELGRGGMGVVYRARQLSLNRIVALKTLRSGIDADPAEESRFRAEAEAVARLQHPHIIQVFDVGSHEGRLFCAMEFAPGGTLAEKLNGNAIPPLEAAVLAELLARAVHAAHEHDIVHRDLKPKNVLLSKDGSPKVADFGLAKRLDLPRQTHTGAVMGTPCYMAPEQAEGRSAEIGPWTDVWSLGAILYELLSGRPPFRAESSLETMIQVVQQEPIPLTTLNPALPKALETICLRCLRKSRDDRYPSAQALADDLRQFLTDGTIRSTASPIPVAARRNSRRLAAIVSAAIACGVIVGLLVWRGRSSSDNQPHADKGKETMESREPQDGATTQRTPSTAAILPVNWDFVHVNPSGVLAEKFDRIAFSSRAVGYVASRQALYRTDDAGKNWRPLPQLGNPPGRVFVLQFVSDNDGWLGTDRLRHTSDGGQSWNEITLPGQPMKAVSALTVMSDGGLLAGGSSQSGELELFRSTPSRNEWTKLALPTAYKNWYVGGLSAGSGRTVFAALFRGYPAGGTIVRSDDGGDTWSVMLSHPEDIYHVTINADGRAWSAGADGVAWQTRDGGRNWQQVESPTGGMTASCLAANRASQIACMPLMNGRIALTSDSWNWTSLDAGRPGFGYSMPSAAVDDSGCVFVLSADGWVGRYLRP